MVFPQTSPKGPHPHPHDILTPHLHHVPHSGIVRLQEAGRLQLLQHQHDLPGILAEAVLADSLKVWM